MYLLLLLGLINTVIHWLTHRWLPTRYYRKTTTKPKPNQSQMAIAMAINHCRRKKPQWVINEIIKMQAYMPTLSCRQISEAFNQRFNDISIGKSYVAYTIKAHYYHIQAQRKKLKNKPAYTIPFNKIWGMDLTFVNQQPVLGITEHHSRQCLQLIPLQQKTTVTILLALLSLLQHTPKPKMIRTDNEACFNSTLMKAVLRILGIKHQTIQKHCPWQNGRIERLFGTFKKAINPLNTSQENHWFLCQDFAYWYNHIRPHQNLNNQTPNTVFQQQLKRWRPPDG